MSTIDDLACAKLAAVGCENSKAVLRELKLFGFPEKDLSQYLRAKAWELEEAVALGLGRHPRNLSLSVIREKCPEQIDLQGKPWSEDQLPTAQLFMDRYELLKRAGFIRDIESEERGGTLWFKPVDLATYARNEWAYMPDAARALMDAATAPATATKPAPAPFAPASANTAAAGQVEPHEGHSGVSEGDKFKACTDWLISEMQKSPAKPFKPTVPDLQKCCKTRFGTAKHPFQRALNAAQEATGVDWYKRGKPKKSAA